MTDQKRKRARDSAAEFRRRNKSQGLCACGGERYRDPMTGRLYKTCIACRARSKSQHPTIPDFVRPVVTKGAKTYSRLTCDISVDLMRRLEEFSIDFDMPIHVILEDAFDLFESITHAHEGKSSDSLSTADPHLILLEVPARRTGTD